MNKFEVDTVIGEGAYGVVLKCRNRETSSVVAIKKFKESEDDEKVRKTMMREVRLLRLLSHGENVVTLHEAFRRKGRLYLVFEYAERNMLELLEHAPHGVPDWQVRLYTFQLLKAIAWCHHHGVMHRDIKPENLLLNTDHSLRLCDFGFACNYPTAGEALTDYVATRWYRAPELLLGSNHYDQKVDVWAVGCIMGELSEGEPAFPGESEIDQLYVIQKALGPLTEYQNRLFLQNQRFAGLKFPDMSRPEGLHLKYGGRIPRLAVDCLRNMLQMEPADRGEAAHVLTHQWFAELVAPPAPPQPAPPPPTELPVPMHMSPPRSPLRSPPRPRGAALHAEAAAAAAADAAAAATAAQQQADAEAAAAQAQYEAQRQAEAEAAARAAQAEAAAQAAAQAQYEAQRQAEAESAAQYAAQQQQQAQHEAQQQAQQQQALAQQYEAQQQALQLQAQAQAQQQAQALAQQQAQALAQQQAQAAHHAALQRASGLQQQQQQQQQQQSSRPGSTLASPSRPRKRPNETTTADTLGPLPPSLTQIVSGSSANGGGEEPARRLAAQELRNVSDELQRRLNRAGLAVGSGAAAVAAARACAGGGGASCGGGGAGPSDVAPRACGGASGGQHATLTSFSAIAGSGYGAGGSYAPPVGAYHGGVYGGSGAYGHADRAASDGRAASSGYGAGGSYQPPRGVSRPTGRYGGRGPQTRAQSAHANARGPAHYEIIEQDRQRAASPTSLQPSRLGGMGVGGGGANYGGGGGGVGGVHHGHATRCAASQLASTSAPTDVETRDVLEALAALVGTDTRRLCYLGLALMPSPPASSNPSTTSPCSPSPPPCPFFLPLSRLVRATPPTRAVAWARAAGRATSGAATRAPAACPTQMRTTARTTWSTTTSSRRCTSWAARGRTSPTSASPRARAAGSSRRPPPMGRTAASGGRRRSRRRAIRRCRAGVWGCSSAAARRRRRTGRRPSRARVRSRATRRRRCAEGRARPGSEATAICELVVCQSLR